MEEINQRYTIGVLFFSQWNIIQYHKTAGTVGLIFKAEIFVFYFCTSLGVLMMNQQNVWW